MVSDFVLLFPKNDWQTSWHFKSCLRNSTCECLIGIESIQDWWFRSRLWTFARSASGKLIIMRCLTELWVSTSSLRAASPNKLLLYSWRGACRLVSSYFPTLRLSLWGQTKITAARGRTYNKEWWRHPFLHATVWTAVYYCCCWAEHASGSAFRKSKHESAVISHDSEVG